MKFKIHPDFSKGIDQFHFSNKLISNNDQYVHVTTPQRLIPHTNITYKHF